MTKSGPDAALLQRREHRERGRDERRLLDGGVEQLLERRRGSRGARGRGRYASLPRAKTALAAGIASAMSRPIPASNEPWPGKQKAIFVHAASSIVHRISALPHVRPAPIPVMSTSLPG